MNSMKYVQIMYSASKEIQDDCEKNTCFAAQGLIVKCRALPMIAQPQKKRSAPLHLSRHCKEPLACAKLDAHDPIFSAEKVAEMKIWKIHK